MKIDFLYGTAWKEAQTEDSVFRALKAGYRAIGRKHRVGVMRGSEQ